MKVSISIGIEYLEVDEVNVYVGIEGCGYELRGKRIKRSELMKFIEKEIVEIEDSYEWEEDDV